MSEVEENRRRDSINGGTNSSPWVSLLNLCNAAIGAGVLSFPYAFRQTGILGGLCFTGLIWMIEVAALRLLVRASESYNAKSYQQLVQLTLGQKMAVVISVTMMVFLVGGLISYLIITGDVFEPIFAAVFGKESTLADRRFVIILCGCTIVLPLSWKRNLQDLKFTSTISVGVLLYLTLCLVLFGAAKFSKEGLPTNVMIFNGGIKAFIAMDIVVFAFHCHIQSYLLHKGLIGAMLLASSLTAVPVFPIFAELAQYPDPFFGVKAEVEGGLEDAEQLVISPDRSEKLLSSSNYRTSARIQMMDQVILCSMLVCVIGYCVVGEVGYLMFPDVEGDLLKSFGEDNFFMNVARVGMALVAMVCYPLASHPARSIVDDAIKHVFKLGDDSYVQERHAGITLSLFGLSLFSALLLTDLGAVFSIVGATGGVMVIFVFPGLLLIQQGSRNELCKLLSGSEINLEEQGVGHFSSSFSNWLAIFGGSAMIGFGGLIFIATFYVTVSNMARLGA